MIGEKLNPKIDFVFRKLFGSEENKDLLISLINSVVEPASPLVDVVLKNPFNLASYQGDKESVLDIKAVDEKGVWYDVEMQVNPHRLYGRRAIYYAAKTYSDQIEQSQNYAKLNTTIGIHFLDFRFFDDDRVRRQFVFKDALTNEAPAQLDGLQLFFVEMPKFDKDWPEVRTALDRWVAFLNKAATLTRGVVPQPLASEPALAKAVAQLDVMSLTVEERSIYEGEVKKRMLDEVQLNDARQEAMQQGMQQGIQHVLINQLTRKIGVVPDGIVRRLHGLSTEALDELSLEVLQFQSYAEVERWLTRH